MNLKDRYTPTIYWWNQTHFDIPDDYVFYEFLCGM